jgi:hypothetical protein
MDPNEYNIKFLAMVSTTNKIVRYSFQNFDFVPALGYWKSAVWLVKK